MKFGFVALAAGAMLAASAPASAAVIDVSGNFGTFGGAQLALGTYTDTFTFMTTEAKAISGGVSTDQLFNTGTGALWADLDLFSVTIDAGTANALSFTPDVGNSDLHEAYSLLSSTLAAGTHTLAISYRVDTAMNGSPAGYSGHLTLGNSPATSAVPEAATWAMFVGAFGMIGGSLRRRKQEVTFA